MRILYIGYAISEKLCEETKGASVAGNKMQIGILQELNKLHKRELDLVTIFPTAPFPKVKKIFFKKRDLKVGHDKFSTSIPFINIPFIKQITQMLSLYIFLKKYMKNNYNVKILTYNANPIISLPLKWMKRENVTDVICLFADPPIYNNYSLSIKSFLEKINYKIIKKNILNYTKIVALNKKAIKIFAPKIPSIVIDGGFRKQDYTNIQEVTSNSIYPRFNIVYSGALTKYNGIEVLVEAMNYFVEKNVELHIYGDGFLKEYVEKSTQINNKIKYFGKVTNSEMLQIQKDASFLINPRIVRNPISQVTFPSKMIEYLLSGTPVLCTKLNGLSKDYIRYINIIDDSTSETMAQSISSIIQNNSYEDLKFKALQGKKYIYNTKSWDKQAQHIYKFILEE